MAKPPVKIVVRHPRGSKFTYGPLMMATVGGVKCLARKEVLLLLGLTPKRVKVVHFVEDMRVKVVHGTKASYNSYLVHNTLYVLNYHDLDTLVNALTQRGHSAYLQHFNASIDGRGGEWVYYNKLYNGEPDIKHPPLKKITRWHRLKLLVKRLFGKEELVHTPIDNSDLNRLLTMATKQPKENGDGENKTMSI